MIDSALLSLILRRYAADGATGLVGAALTSETTLSISAAATGSKKTNEQGSNRLKSGSKPNSIGAEHNEAMGHRMTRSNSVAEHSALIVSDARLFQGHSTA